MPTKIIDYADVLPAARLHELLRYEPATGKLFWRYRPAFEFKQPKYELIWNGTYADTEAGTLGKDGYTYLHLIGRRIVAHRAIWAMEKGYWPMVALDHIDQDRSNNRMSNLREAGYDLNALNRSMKSDNTSGYTGVDPTPSGTFHARIRLRGRRLFIGAFSTPEAAAEARKKVQDQWGFSPNHGRARV